MTEQSWKPLFRTSNSTVTRALQSPAFIDSRRRAGAIIGDSIALRMLANSVDSVDQTDAPSRRLRTGCPRASASCVPERTVSTPAPRSDPIRARRGVQGTDARSAAATAARERLLVAALDYLITPVDMVPDFHVGGYIDDVLLLTWVFGAAVHELEPFLEDDLHA